MFIGSYGLFLTFSVITNIILGMPFYKPFSHSIKFPPVNCPLSRMRNYSGLIRDCGAQSAIDCMSRIAKLTSRWLMNRGFTIGIDDVTRRWLVFWGAKARG